MHQSQTNHSTARKRHLGARELADSPAMPAVEQYFVGLSYPASRQHLIDAARRNQAPEHILEILEDLPERTFHNHAEVDAAMELIDW